MAEEGAGDALKLQKAKLDVLYDRIANAMQIKTTAHVEKLKKNFTEKQGEAFQSIMGNNEDGAIFFVIQKSAEACDVLTECPGKSALTKRCIIFCKLWEGPVDADTIPNFVHFEINKLPLDLLYVMCNEIYVPILHNPQNQAGWTELISKDLMEKLNNFVAQMYLTIGQIKGRTLLPLPPTKIMNSTTISDKDKAHIFESSIITWSKQIRKVLETEPEQALKQKDVNPDPMTEIVFWKNKSENLNSIHEQLKSDKVALITKTLRESKSTYTNQFDKLKKEITTSRMEANDNYLFLKTLETHFSALCSDSSDGFTSLPQLFLPIMHTILLIWKRSGYYKTAPRLVVLLREICNAIINKARLFVSGEALIAMIQNKDEVQSACEKLQTTIDVCTKFKDIYFEYKAQAEGTWKFPPNALFIRLDSFLERCHDIFHITNTILQFNKLENIQIGCTKGKNLTETVNNIFDEFNESVVAFNEITYDLMDIGAKCFDDDFFRFRNKIKELERRLASVITQSFDDADTLADRFKLLDSFEVLLKRPVIQDELEKKHIVLIEAFKKDLKDIQKSFLENQPLVDAQDERAPIFNNLPPVAGALTWTKSILNRLRDPMEKLQNLSAEITEKEEFKDINKMYKAICKNIDDYEKKKILDWQVEVQEQAVTKLDQPLVARNESDPTLKVNFDADLVRLLREVKYYKQLDMDVPGTAENIYSNDETYRKQINKLDWIVVMYNTVVTTLHPVEEPLVSDRIERMDQILEPGLKDLMWKNGDQIDKFIMGANTQVSEVWGISNIIKEDLVRIKECLDGMNKPLIERKPKPTSPDDFLNIHQASINNSHTKIKGDGNIITKLIKEINDAVKIDRKSKSWRDYQEFINDIVIEGISKAICTS